MINHVLTRLDVLPYGPYKGWYVQEVLRVDPEELTRYTDNGCEPLYNVSPSVLREAHEAAQDKLGWDEFMDLWNRS